MEHAPALSAIEMITAMLRVILRGVRAGLGAWRVEPVLAVLLYRRAGETLGRIERMLRRFQAGRLWRVTQRAAVMPGRMRRKPTTRLPHRFGWLVQAGGHQAAGLGAQLQVVLNTPEMTQLLATSPQAVRILRPWCRALALDMPGVTRVAAAQIGERAPRRCQPRARPEPFRIPLPRGVCVAARRDGFGKDR